jgi:putative chitinase
MIERKLYFDNVRDALFGGALTQQQVDGQEAILTCWDTYRDGKDLRFLAYMLATTFHETAKTMTPIAEYGHGEGHEYGETDSETGQAYYGRGYVQLTWRDNYHRADVEIDEAFGVDPNMEGEADNALVPKYAAAVLFLGMEQGWFRQHKLADYFNEEDDNPIEARDIINGDVDKNGPLIADYHKAFLEAVTEACADGAPVPEPEPEPEAKTVDIDVTASPGVELTFIVNGVVKWQTP